MRKKLIASLSILAFAFVIAAFAYAQNTNTLADKPSCCGDSCPMKAKGHDANGEHAKMDCCKHEDGKAGGCCGDSCPMKKKGDGVSATAASAEAQGCCCDCCGDSCPMKKSEGTSAAAASTEDKACCDCCDCCKGEKETSA